MRRGRRPPAEWPQVAIGLAGISHLGGAVGRLEDRVYFVAYGLPGETVGARVIDQRGSFSRAEATEVVGRPAPERVPVPCSYFGRCGGCAWQHAAYDAQLAFKTRTVREQLVKIGGFDDPPVRPMIGATSSYHYRNHARFSGRRDGTLGFARPQSHAVLTIEHCHVTVPAINEILATLNGHAARLHQVTIRHSMRTGQSLVYPAIAGVPIETGQSHLEDEVLGRRFRIAANSFFQVNTRPDRRALPDAIRAPWIAERLADWSQADLLALIAIDRLELTGGETVVDAYSGVGTFALLIAERAGRVLAVEEAHSAVEDARANGAGSPNVEIVHARVEKFLPTLDAAPDAVILDPARTGCARLVLDALIDRRVPRVVYVSCDPSTLSRDLRVLVDAGYTIEDIQPIDMFPQTHHIECVATLAL